MLYLLLMTALTNAGAGARTGPHIEPRGGSYELVMPNPMWAALEKHVPNFTIYRFDEFEPSLFRPGLGRHSEVTDRQSPFAVVGDFNGDRIRDVIVNGCTPTSCGLIAVLSHRKRFVAADVGPPLPQARGYPRPNDVPMETVLRLVRPGVIHSPHLEGKPLVLKTDAVEDIFVGKGSGVYYYSGSGSFEYYATGD